MRYSRTERETSIVWDEEERIANIYTASQITMRKLNRLCEAYPQEYQRIRVEKDADGTITAAKYTTACKYVRFGKPASEAQKERGRQIAALAAEKRKEEEQ